MINKINQSFLLQVHSNEMHIVKQLGNNKAEKKDNWISFPFGLHPPLFELMYILCILLLC